MFRKLYWITEELQSDGSSRVIGVFTSIPNLVKEGLAGIDRGSIRLILTKLDCQDGALGAWTGPAFAGLPQTLSEFARTEEFSAEQCDSLLHALTAAG